MLILDNERAVRTDAADLGPETLVLADGAELFLECLLTALHPTAEILTGKRGRLGGKNIERKERKKSARKRIRAFARNIY